MCCDIVSILEGSLQNSVQREEGAERGDRRPSVGTNDEGWRPPPPGLQGRANSRGGSAGGGAPPGLGSNGEQWEKPWGAGDPLFSLIWAQ